MSDFYTAYLNGDPDGMYEALLDRFPETPEPALAAVAVELFFRVTDPDEIEELEPRLGDLMEQINQVWKDNGW